MSKNDQCHLFGAASIEISDDDILSAMESIPGYIDITTADFKEIYQCAYRHAFERLGRSITAIDIMTKDVITAFPETSLIETAKLMAENSISGLPVINRENNIIGVISEKDFLWKMGAKKEGSFMGVVAECLSNKGCLAMPMPGKCAGDIMNAPVITAESNCSISILSKILRDNHINRIPIIDHAGKLIGIVSRGDLVDSFCANIL